MNSDLKKINKVKKNLRSNGNINNPRFVERLIKINRVSKVTKGGKKLSFRAIVVIGDEKKYPKVKEELSSHNIKVLSAPGVQLLFA